MTSTSRAAFLLAAVFAAGGMETLRAETLEEKRDAKLQSAFLKRAPWITDYDKARATARETGKPIFAYFTRSYAP